MTTSESVEESCRIVQDVYDERLAAANARVAELEESEARAVARAKDIEAECVRVERRVIAANARADAAEQRYCQAKSRASSEILVLDRACAALVSDASAQRDQAREMAGERSEKERAANARADALHARVAELERLNTNIRGAWISANNRAIEANARVAELQAQNATLRESVDWERGLKDAFLPYQERAVRAEARVAELETPMSWKNERDRASARAEAAERATEAAVAGNAAATERARCAEARADAAERDAKQAHVDTKATVARLARAEAEAAALREQLAAANALLAELKSDTLLVNSTRWWNRVYAHLSAQARREAKK